MIYAIFVCSLRQFLYKNQVAVSVINLLSIKRIIQMKLAKIKTDMSDVMAICEYALHNEVPIYNALTDEQKTALLLIVLTDGFTKFENSAQLCSYAGITPTERTSGSSVRGRSRISKVGNRKLRNLLFLCSFSACKHNTACKAQFERIVNKGKSKKLALIAVSNKLLRQAFAVVKSGVPYNSDYRSILLKQ